MAIREIIVLPDKQLRLVSKPIEKVTAEIRKTGLRVDDSAAVFTRMGADVTERIYPGMGHLVNDDEIAYARRIMDRIHNP